MSAHYYRLPLALSASLSLILAGILTGILAGCADSPPAPAADTLAGAAPAHLAVHKVRNDSDDTDETLWTWLGLGKRRPENPVGPQTGATVSPVLWQAAHDTLHFAGISSEDPITGVVQTKWYSPPNKPDERLRVSVFILSRVLTSSSIAVNVEREARAPDGTWKKTPVAREAVAGIDSAILLRARHIHSERYREMNYQ